MVPARSSAADRAGSRGARGGRGGKAVAGARKTVRCYLCAHPFEVSQRTMSTSCPKCNRAIKVEDVVVKSYLPVTDLQTCGRITITKKGRVVAKRIECGEGIACEGTIEGAVRTDADIEFGPTGNWKGATLRAAALRIAPGATLDGVVTVPFPKSESVEIETKQPAKPSPARGSTT